METHTTDRKISQSASDEIVAAQRPYIWGYDAVRFAAMFCVALRHLLSIYDLDPRTIPMFIGLPAFSALSGYLALQSRGNALNWLAKRLSRIYSSYLIFIFLMLFANHLIGYKRLSIPLAVSQIFGLAALTHPGQLVGVHTWFITFIVVCYIAATLVRWKRWLLWVLAAVGIGGCHSAVPLSDLFLTFFAGGIVATMRGVRSGSVFLSTLLFVAYLATSERWYVTLMSGTLSLLIGSLLAGRRPTCVAFASSITYEFYLCHGPVYLGLERFGHLPLPANLIAGTVLATLFALILHMLAKQAREVVASLYGYWAQGRHI